MGAVTLQEIDPDLPMSVQESPAKMCTIMDRNGMDQQKQKILRKGGKITRKNYTEKKDHKDPDNHHGVITHLEPDILESEVKWETSL